MDEPIVSVIMPAYNAEAFIEDAIASVQAQTMAQWELLVVDDGSTDKTREILRRLAETDGRIHPVAGKGRQGAAASRNQAMDLAKGQYLAFLDADDLWRPEKLERQLALAESTGADLVCCSYAMIDPAGQPCHRDFLVCREISFEGMLRRNEIGCSTVLLSPSAAGYRFSVDFYHEDYVLWLQMLQDGLSLRGLPEVLADYRVQPGSRSGNKLKSARNRWKIYRDYLRLPLPKRLWAMGGYMLAGLKKYR